MRNLGILLILFLSALTMHAQEAAKNRPLRLGMGLLATAYVGDLNYEGQQFYRFNPGFTASLQFPNKKVLMPQLVTGVGKFVAQNRELEVPPGYDVNNYVETSVFFVDFRLKFKAFPTKRVNPYASIGIGILNYTPKDIDGNSLSDNFESREEGEEYGSVTAGFPFSLGVDVELNYILALGIEYTHRFTGSDYLDNIGNLGSKKGNDGLNQFSLSLFLTFDPEHPILNRHLKSKERR